MPRRRCRPIYDDIDHALFGITDPVFRALAPAGSKGTTVRPSLRRKYQASISIDAKSPMRSPSKISTNMSAYRKQSAQAFSVGENRPMHSSKPVIAENVLLAIWYQCRYIVDEYGVYEE